MHGGEKRQAKDGQWYTYAEFEEFCGLHAGWYWQGAFQDEVKATPARSESSSDSVESIQKAGKSRKMKVQIMFPSGEVKLYWWETRESTVGQNLARCVGPGDYFGGELFLASATGNTFWPAPKAIPPMMSSAQEDMLLSVFNAAISHVAVCFAGRLHMPLAAR